MADCAIFICDRQRRYWRRRGLLARQNVVIYDGVDTDKFSDTTTREHRAATRRVFGFAEPDFVIGAIGDLRKDKNQIQLIAAVERLRRAGIPARALLIGDGAQRTAIEERASERGVTRDIGVTGFVHDVRPFVAACDVLAVCDLTDAMSLGALEAMALCKPVVHSNLGGAGEMIHSGYNGFLFRANDTTALVEHLAHLTNPDDRRSIGEHARGVVERRFSEQTMIESYEGLLLGLTARFNGRRQRSFGRARHDGGPAESGSGRS
jgi:glycosyltransferase involved in cell wall biosynthesis